MPCHPTLFLMANFGLYLCYYFLLFISYVFILRFGRNKFQESMKIVHKTDQVEIDWDSFKYMVFDIPTHKGTYDERYNLLGKY